MTEEINQPVACRACGSTALHRFATFGGRLASLFVRPEDWANYLCGECGAISHFLDQFSADSYVSYSDSAYRESISILSQGADVQTVNQPISLPWSTITSLRARAVAEHLSPFISSVNSDGLGHRLLDFGGYNGFTAYGLTAAFQGLQITVADLDPKGLKMAKALSMEVVDLASQELSKEIRFDLCISLHCLEHLEQPKEALISIRDAMQTKGVCYFEVPNAYGVPIGDPAHLISFDIHSFCALIESAGFRILNSGFTSTPDEALDFDYYYSNSKENIFVVCAPLENVNNLPKISRPVLSSLNKVIYKFALADIRLSFVLLKNHFRRFLLTNRKLARSVVRVIASPFYVVVLSVLRFVSNSTKW